MFEAVLKIDQRITVTWGQSLITYIYMYMYEDNVLVFARRQRVTECFQLY